MAQAAAAVPVVRRHAETAQRWQKALQRALDQGLEVFLASDTGERFVTSATRLDALHRTDGRRCSCPAGLAGDPVCTHRAAVRAVLGWLALPEAEAPATADCPACCGCGVRDFGRYALPCETCGGSGRRPDPRPQGLPTLSIVAEAA